MADKKIDPRLPLPPIEGYEHEDRSGEIRPSSYEQIDIDLPPATQTTPGLQPPSMITVVNQVFRKGPDGKTVTDLIIDVQDVEGAESYEVRTSVG